MVDCFLASDTLEVMALGTSPLLGDALYNAVAKVRSWGRPHGRPFKMLGAGPLLGQALRNSWDRPALGTGPPKCLGQAHSLDMPLKMLVTG